MPELKLVIDILYSDPSVDEVFARVIYDHISDTYAIDGINEVFATRGDYKEFLKQLLKESLENVEQQNQAG